MHQSNSYIKNLRSKYNGNELTHYPGDNQLRYEAFSPIFKNLYENKIVYYERFIGIIKVENVIISPERFSATAIPYLTIKRGNRYDNFFLKAENWNFSATWASMLLSDDNSISVPYANWSVWCDPELLKNVEEFVLNDKMDDALLLTVDPPTSPRLQRGLIKPSTKTINR